MPTYRIRHTTRYDYSGEVRLDPHRVLLLPRSTAAVDVRAHEIRVDPAPSGQTITLGPAGNPGHTLWFTGITRKLHIICESVIEQRAFNPFNFVVYPVDCAYMPFHYAPDELPLLQPYLDSAPAAAPVQLYAQRLLQETGGQTTTFLSSLCAKIMRDIAYERRDHGRPRPPEQTLDLGHGACRDATVLFMAAARALGLAARFVSGYAVSGVEAAQHDLHAWAEVYIPGAGWLGFDPATGLLATEAYVPVATAPAPAAAAPIHGAYRGDAHASMTFSLDIAEITDP